MKSSLVVATKNIVPFDFVGFFAPAIVRFRHENYRPPRPVHAARSIPKPPPPASRNPGASPTTGHAKPDTTQTTPFSLGSSTVLGLALPSMAWMSADTAGLQTGYLGALAPQGFSTVLDVEVPLPPGRASTYFTRGAQTYPDDVTGQRWLGCTADSRRTTDARHPRLPSDSRKVHGPSS